MEICRCNEWNNKESNESNKAMELVNMQKTEQMKVAKNIKY
jgi:hypothetical protein